MHPTLAKKAAGKVAHAFFQCYAFGGRKILHKILFQNLPVELVLPITVLLPVAKQNVVGFIYQFHAEECTC